MVGVTRSALVSRPPEWSPVFACGEGDAAPDPGGEAAHLRRRPALQHGPAVDQPLGLSQELFDRLLAETM